MNSHPNLPPQSEQLLRLLPDDVYLLDADGMLLYVNPAVLRRYGWTAGDLVGQSLLDLLLFAPAFRATLLGQLRETGSWQGQSERIMPDGSLRTVRAHWQLLDEAIGDASIIGIEHDISEQRAKELEYQQSRKLAKIGILAEGIAHELRNPLSYALSASQLLAEEGLDEEVRQQCVQTITTGLKKAGMIVDNMLSLGRPRAQIRRQRLALESVIMEALDAVASHKNYRVVTITHQLPPDGLMVSGNHDMLVQVFHNVLANALNEMPGGGRILIRGEEDGRQVRIRVSDSGPGVSDEQMKHLFDPFFSASASGGGTGLGLTLSYFIMKEHGGTIEVESVVGKGATFILAFPHSEQE